ncbi:hypothetical protein ACWEAF_05650 [Streptomyces sp. NPDC005071]
MARQISMEAGLAAYRRKCADLLDANILLEAQLAEVEAECEQLRATASAPVSDEPAP